MTTPTFFRTRAALRRWLLTNHAEVAELWLGFYHRQSGKGGITYPEALDEALCFGWIDGVRRNWDQTSYVIRFTPRKKGSNWSLVNLKKARALAKRKAMHPAGLKAYRDRDKSQTSSYEARPVALSPAYLKRLRANTRAWTFFDAQPPWFRRTASAWVMTAKREETRERRLALLIEAAERGERPGPFPVAARRRT